MKSRWSQISLLGFILFLSGCNGYQDITQVDNTWLKAHVGQSVQLRGCLSFACITVPNAQYPRDCVPSLISASGTTGLGLEFSADNGELHTVVNSFYARLSQECLNLELTGIITEYRCAESDTGCVTSYGLSVTSVVPLDR